MSASPFITDAEIIAGLDCSDVELEIDSLDRDPATQKPEGRDVRPRAAVEQHLKARGLTLNLD